MKYNYKFIENTKNEWTQIIHKPTKLFYIMLLFTIINIST